MAPKSSNAAGKGKEALIGEDEEVLQAIVLADSFNKRFKPLTTHKPRCLLPVCNAPLLDWTFESLALAGVQEIFVVCRSHSELIKAAIRESKWSNPSSGLKIVPILTAKETFSPGDALRDVFTRDLIKTGADFVLVMGDLVSNVRIDEVVRVHKERRKREGKEGIMTIVVKESGRVHRTKSKGEDGIFVLDAETDELVDYEFLLGHPRKKNLNLPREISGEHEELVIRNDLIDCGIDVCNHEVLGLFHDNFDYSDIRREFLRGVLTSDILPFKIHCYLTKDGYAARVKDTRSYDAVSKDILSRWAFPLVPDDNHPAGHLYDHNRGNKYIAKDGSVVLSRTCVIGNNTLIGSKTQIHDNAAIFSSVIGCNCSIGPGTTIRDAYIFDNTVIGADCIVERSIIGNGVMVKDKSRVEKGALIGDGVVVGPRARVGKFMRLSKKGDGKKLRTEQKAIGEADVEKDDESEVDSDLEEVESRQEGMTNEELGHDSNALVWPETLDDEVDEESPDNPINLRYMRIGDDCSDLDFSDEDSDEDSDEAGSASSSISSFQFPTIGKSKKIDTSSSSEDEDEEAEFQTEVKLSLERAFLEGHSVDNAAVELKTLRMSTNVPLTKVKEAVIAGIVEHIRLVDGGALALRKEIARVVGRWGKLINKIGGVDSVETVTLLQVHCASSERLPLFGQILAALYQEDIVDEDDISSWHKKPVSRDGGPKAQALGLQANYQRCWAAGGQLIEKINEAESESE